MPSRHKSVVLTATCRYLTAKFLSGGQDLAVPVAPRPLQAAGVAADWNSFIKKSMNTLTRAGRFCRLG